MTRPLMTAALAALVLTAAVSSQERMPMPAKPFVRLAIDTPTRLKSDFDGTRLGELLRSQEFDDIWESFKDAVRDDLGEEGEQSPREERLLELLETMDGRASMAMELEFPEQADEPRFVMMLGLESPDGEALDEVAQLVTELAEAESDVMSDLEIEGHAFVSVKSPDEFDDVSALLPSRFGDALVMFVGMDLEERVGAWLRAEPAPTGEQSVKPIEMDIDLAQLMAMIQTGIEHEQAATKEWGGEFDMPGMPDMTSLLETLRVKGMRELRFTATPRDVQVLFDLAVNYDPQRPAITDLMRPRTAGRSPLLALAPRNHPSWSLGQIRLDELVGLILELVSTYGGEMQMDMATLDAMFGEQFEGLSVQNDVLAHLGDDYLYLKDIDAMADLETAGPMAVVDGTAFALQLQDAAAFAKTIDAVIRGMNLAPACDKKDYRGIETVEMPLLGLVPMTWAFGSDFVALGLGPAGGDQVRLLLDAEVARRAGEEPPAFPDGIQKRLDSMPAGWAAVSVADMVPALDFVVTALEFDDTGFPPEAGEMLRSLSKLLSTHQLGQIVQTTTFEDGQVFVRTVW